MGGLASDRLIDVFVSLFLVLLFLGIMSFTVTPDITTSSLSINNGATSSPGLAVTQVGGGFTWGSVLLKY